MTMRLAWLMRLLCQAGLPGSSAVALAGGTISQPNPADAKEARFGQLPLKLVRRVAGGEAGMKADLPPDRKADDQNGSDCGSGKAPTPPDCRAAASHREDIDDLVGSHSHSPNLSVWTPALTQQMAQQPGRGHADQHG